MIFKEGLQDLVTSYSWAFLSHPHSSRQMGLPRYLSMSLWASALSILRTSSALSQIPAWFGSSLIYDLYKVVIFCETLCPPHLDSHPILLIPSLFF